MTDAAMPGQAMTDERLEEIEAENALLLSRSTERELRVGCPGRRERELINEVRRLRKPADGEVARLRVIFDACVENDALSEEGHSIIDLLNAALVDARAECDRRAQLCTEYKQQLADIYAPGGKLAVAQAALAQLRREGFEAGMSVVSAFLESQECADAVERALTTPEMP